MVKQQSDRQTQRRGLNLRLSIERGFASSQAIVG